MKSVLEKHVPDLVKNVLRENRFDRFCGGSSGRRGEGRLLVFWQGTTRIVWSFDTAHDQPLRQASDR